MSCYLRPPRRRPKDLRARLPERDGAWVVTNRRSFHDYSVGSLVPAVFEHYARILHPAWSADGEPVRWQTVAAWSGRVVHSLAQWQLLSLPGFDQQLSPPFAAPPRQSGLPHDQLAALCDLLATYTSTPGECFVGMWEGYGRLSLTEWGLAPILELDRRTCLVRKGSIDLAHAGGLASPRAAESEPATIFWPADRAWFVASDPDLDSTYVGGSSALIESLLARPDLEAWPAQPDDRVAIDSDELNLP